jgi:hypothetical protein
MDSPAARPEASIPLLLKEHADDVKDILAMVSEFLKEKNDPVYNHIAKDLPLDEITVLKYVLSALRKKDKCKPVAFDRICETLEFRKTYAEPMETARKLLPGIFAFVPCSTGGFLGDEMVVCSQYGQADFNAIKDKYGTLDNVFAHAAIQTEQFRLLLDKRTRETGRLCKLLHIVDIEGLSFSKATNSTVIRAMGKISTLNEVISPQFLSRAVLIHPPGIFKAVFAVAKPFLSKSTTDKIVICGAKKGQHDCSECPFLKRYVDAASQIPKEVGGQFASIPGIELRQ